MTVDIFMVVLMVPRCWGPRAPAQFVQVTIQHWSWLYSSMGAVKYARSSNVSWRAVISYLGIFTHLHLSLYGLSFMRFFSVHTRFSFSTITDLSTDLQDTRSCFREVI